MKKVINYCLIIFLVVAITACSAATTIEKPDNQVKKTDAPVSEGLSTTQQATQEDKVINLMMFSAPDTFNPYFSKGNYGKYAGGELVLNSLFEYNPDWELIPSLATDYSISDDGKEYIFFLQKDVNWHDGKPFTVRDVVFTFKSIMDPGWSGTGYVSLKSIIGAEDYKAGLSQDVPGLEIVDDYTLKIKLENPYSPFIEGVGIGLWILPEHAFDGINASDMASAPFSTAPIGTGPMIFVDYVQDQYVEYDTNPTYFLGAPKFDKLILKVVAADIALAALEKGEIDASTRVGMGTVNVSDYEKVKEMNNLNVTTFKTSSYQELVVNVTKPYLSVKVRQALSYAIDRDSIVSQLLQGIGTRAIGPISETSPWYNQSLPRYDYDPDRAIELLKEAGWDPSQVITLMVPKGNIVRERSAPILQQFFKEVGIEVQLQFTDFPTLMAAAEALEYDLALVGSSTGMLDPDANLYPFLHSSQLRPTGWNLTGWADPETDELLDAGAVETDPVKRKEIYDQVQYRVVDQLPIIYLYYEQSVGTTSKRLKNAIPNEIGIEWNIQEWEIE